jgi:hypothetical protein
VKILAIRWKKLVDEEDQTYPRCGVTCGNNTYEEIPEGFIIQAGLLAAAELFAIDN